MHMVYAWSMKFVGCMGYYAGYIITLHVECKDQYAGCMSIVKGAQVSV